MTANNGLGDVLLQRNCGTQDAKWTPRGAHNAAVGEVSVHEIQLLAKAVCKLLRASCAIVRFESAL